MEKLNAIKDKFRKYLRRNGLSVTPQRQQTLEQIIDIDSHIDIEYLIKKLKNKNIDVSRATVYRTILHLKKAGILREIDLGEKHEHYEIIPGKKHHEHLVCRICEEIQEFSDNRLEKNIEDIAQSYNFLISDHSIEIFGVCKKCMNKENK